MILIIPIFVYRAITDENRGKKMLMKFGWQEGQGLGRNNAGMQEPVGYIKCITLLLRNTSLPIVIDLLKQLHWL